MKKGLLICSLLLCTSALFAEFDLGAKVGYTTSIGFGNMANVADYQWSNVKSEFGNGFHVGAFARIGGEKLYVQPEVLYNYQKTDYEVTFQNVASGEAFNADKYVTSSTVDVPILLGYKLFDIKVLNMRVLVGPKLRFNAGSKIEFKDKTSHEVAEEIKEEVKKTSVGLEAGIGFDILKRVSLDVRYNLISNISKETQWKEEIVANYEKPLNTFVVSLGFIIL